MPRLLPTYLPQLPPIVFQRPLAPSASQVCPRRASIPRRCHSDRPPLLADATKARHLDLQMSPSVHVASKFIRILMFRWTAFLFIVLVPRAAAAAAACALLSPFVLDCLLLHFFLIPPSRWTPTGPGTSNEPPLATLLRSRICHAMTRASAMVATVHQTTRNWTFLCGLTSGSGQAHQSGMITEPTEALLGHPAAKKSGLAAIRTESTDNELQSKVVCQCGPNHLQ